MEGADLPTRSDDAVNGRPDGAPCDHVSVWQQLVARVRRVTAYALPAALDTAILIAVSLLSVLALEQPLNPAFPSVVPRQFAIAEFGIVLLACIALYFLGQRRGALVAIVPAALGTFGLALYFVMQFKSTVIMPVDLFALNTAADVAGGYSYSLGAGCLKAIAYVGAGIAACSLLSPMAPRLLATTWARVGCNLGAGVTCACALLGVLVAPDYQKLGVRVDTWNPTSAYLEQGSLVTFIATAQNMSVRPPEGYSKATASALLEKYSVEYDETLGASESRLAAEQQFSSETPSVVVVMDETFADLSIYKGLACNYAGPTFFKTGMTDSLATGSLSMSVLGGGTCNSEFEMLTGLPLAYVGGSNYPYTMYDLNGMASLASQLSSVGYQTTAIHPAVGSNWNRSSVYSQLGFDRFLTIDDFEGAPTLRDFVTDRATFDMALEVLRSSDEPQFIFDVTIQNHSGYDTGKIPADQLTSYQPAGYDDSATNPELNEYLTCIQASDEDLAYFVGELSKLDRPVVLVYFGDHQPSLGNAYNELLCADDAGALEHAQRPYQTVYTIWANYDVAGHGQAPVVAPSAPSSLAAQTLQLVGAPLTDYQKAQLVLAEQMPAVNAFGARSADGTWHALDDETSPVAQESRDYSYMAYLTFETRNS